MEIFRQVEKNFQNLAFIALNLKFLTVDFSQLRYCATRRLIITNDAIKIKTKEMINFILLRKYLQFLELFGLLTNVQNAQLILEDKV